MTITIQVVRLSFKFFSFNRSLILDESLSDYSISSIETNVTFDEATQAALAANAHFSGDEALIHFFTR